MSSTREICLQHQDAPRTLGSKPLLEPQCCCLPHCPACALVSCRFVCRSKCSLHMASRRQNVLTYQLPCSTFCRGVFFYVQATIRLHYQVRVYVDYNRMQGGRVC
jgi:hypothetical protein